MSENKLNSLQKIFLTKLFKCDGATVIDNISSRFYGMSEQQIRDEVLAELESRGLCVCETLKNRWGETRTVAFITLMGLTEVTGAQVESYWSIKNLTYERRCHGYHSVSEYLKNEKATVDYMGAVVQAVEHVGYGMMHLGKKAGKTIAELKKDLKKSQEKYNMESEISIAVMQMILEKLIADQNLTYFDQEMKDAEKITYAIMEEMQKKRLEYDWYFNAV